MPSPIARAVRIAAGLAALVMFAPAAAVAEVEDFIASPKIDRITPMPEGQYRLPPVSDPNARMEAIQGRPNFRKVASLPGADPNRALSAMVGQLWLKQEKGYSPHCTGFLVGPQLLMTNYHCVADMETMVPDNPRRLIVAMEHLEEGQIGSKESLSAVSGLVKMDFLLDYALLLLDQPLGKRYGWLTLETDPEAIARSREVKIIQHPAGRSKEIVLEDTEMVQQNALYLHYLADTEGGSSGSPVFDLAGSRVIGLHHVGTNKYNEGLSMARIATEIAFYLPQDQGAALAATTAESEADAQADAAAVAPVATAPRDATRQSGASGTVLDLLLAPPSPMSEEESTRPLSLGVAAPKLD